MPRLFIAIELPDAVTAELGALREPGLKARWLEPAQMHLTVSFLGDLDDGVSSDRLSRALEGVAIEPLSVQVQGVGCFGPADQARVLWAGVGPIGPLVELKGKVDRRLAAAGLSTDNRAYRPHITLARFGRGGGDVGALLSRHKIFSLPPFGVSHVALFRSFLQPEGSRYTVIKRFNLN
ncbi:RNA 2',3'-cyclic phosphodiesterase [Marinimicrobium alkaliphilum]|uniref:RNA 2',3'-cyclic phosphodiesterase n=1 Tax=Marinimicrobium alkaliphilum TaxID=2202654 RepID=UPI000DB8FAAF